ncbi:hypothetical protein M1N79_02655 [Dehalococcoidia bacterium]|nr:hypothetical protein [Dehalococcoidia bacterium]
MSRKSKEQETLEGGHAGDQGKDEKPRPESKDSWSDCGQLFFTGGKGYGLTPDGRTICLGNRDNILTAFNTGEPGPGFMPLQRQVLMSIIEYRKEVIQNGRTSEVQVKRSSHVRSRASGDVQRRVADTKRPAPGKRLPGCAP